MRNDLNGRLLLHVKTYCRQASFEETCCFVDFNKFCVNLRSAPSEVWPSCGLMNVHISSKIVQSYIFAANNPQKMRENTRKEGNPDVIYETLLKYVRKTQRVVGMARVVE